MLWLALGAIALVVLAVLIVPLLRTRLGGATRFPHDLAVYREQLRELEADLDQGAIGEAEAAAARREIERRILRAAETAGARPAGDRRLGRLSAIALALLLPAATAGIYWKLGSPGLPGAPWGERQVESKSGSGHDDLPATTATLAERLRQNPDDPDRWQLLGRSYLQLGRYAEAADAFARAIEFQPDDTDLRAAQGEALSFVADGTVTPVARVAFEAALAIDGRHPVARYYLALAQYQAGRPQAAYDRWLALAKVSPTGAPWLGPLRGQLQRVAQELGIDLEAEWPRPPETAARDEAAGPGPSAAEMRAAQDLSPEERQAFVRSMVERLADRLAEEPGDHAGWMRLGRAYGVLDEREKSVEAYNRAAELRPDDPSTQAQAQAQALLGAGAPDAPPPAEAIAVYRRILELDADNAEALWFTGLADAEAGDFPAALTAWERLLVQLDPESDAYAQIRDEIERARARLP